MGSMSNRRNDRDDLDDDSDYDRQRNRPPTSKSRTLPPRNNNDNRGYVSDEDTRAPPYRPRPTDPRSNPNGFVNKPKRTPTPPPLPPPQSSKKLEDDDSDVPSDDDDDDDDGENGNFLTKARSKITSVIVQVCWSKETSSELTAFVTINFFCVR